MFCLASPSSSIRMVKIVYREMLSVWETLTYSGCLRRKGEGKTIYCQRGCPSLPIRNTKTRRKRMLKIYQFFEKMYPTHCLPDPSIHCFPSSNVLHRTQTIRWLDKLKYQTCHRKKYVNKSAIIITQLGSLLPITERCLYYNQILMLTTVCGIISRNHTNIMASFNQHALNNFPIIKPARSYQETQFGLYAIVGSTNKILGPSYFVPECLFKGHLDRRCSWRCINTVEDWSDDGAREELWQA